MGDKSRIEWTDATWNPVTGCTRVSPGCDNCYAERFAERFRGVPGHVYERGFDVQERPDRLDVPIRWQRPRRIFVNSMSDLWHAHVSTEYIDSVFRTMEEASERHGHTFQVLTKRAQRMSAYLRRRYGPEGDAPPRIWIGVSVENPVCLHRVKWLRRAPAAVRFLSIEPLLAPLGDWLDLGGIDWVIVGGESGPRSRPMMSAWVRDIRDMCDAADVPFFFKQWGGYRPKERGRVLDGREHSDFPREPMSAGRQSVSPSVT